MKRLTLLCVYLLGCYRAIGSDWTRLPQTPLGPRETAVTYDPQRQAVVVFGGASCCAPDFEDDWHNDTWFFKDGKWTLFSGRTPSSLTGRTGISLFYHQATQSLYQFGGMNCWSCVGPNSELWQLVAGVGWMGGNGGCRGPAPRHRAAWGVLGGLAYVFGGYDSCDIPLNDFWVYDQDFHWQSLSTAPPNRSEASMVGTGGMLVLFGGRQGQTALADTWLYDGQWKTLGGMTAISPRYGHSLAYDSSRNRVILFGGHGQERTVLLDDTWEFNPETYAWSKVSTIHSPEARMFHAMVYEPVGKRVLLIGGTKGWGVYFGDFWEYR